ncbi:MAG: hypothetical protein J5892_01215 [Bacilli bacterium]|nr:hypothetical protein [Bacilli bacterium]
MRTKYSIKNFILQFITNIISIIFLFVSQTLLIKLLGVEYNGLNGLFTNIIILLNLLELGIGSSITYNLYKHIKNNDTDIIKSIMYFYKKAYYIISFVVLLVGLSFLPILKFIVKDVSVDINIYIVYILFVTATVATYILSYKRNIIIADQKNYLINIIQIINIIIVNLFQVLILWFTKNYYLFLIIKIICILLENLIINFKASRMYPYLKEKDIKPLNPEIKESIISRVKALILHKVSWSVTNGTDNILISAFLGIKTVGLYTCYNYIISSVKKIFGNIIQTSTSSIGNLLVENDYEKNYLAFKRIHLLNFWIAVTTSTCLLLITEPFITLWIGKKYLLDFSVLIVLVLCYFQSIMRSTYIAFKDAAGIWVEDKYVPLVQLTINLIASIILLKIFGLIGVFMGTFISHLVVWFYSYPVFIYHKLFNRSIKKYYGEVLLNLGVFLIVIGITYLINLYTINIITTIIISFLIPNLLLIIIYNRSSEFKYYLQLLLKIIKKK